MSRKIVRQCACRALEPRVFLLAPLALAMSGAQPVLAAVSDPSVPTSIPKYVTPLVIPPVMKNTGTANDYDIAVRQFQQQILPGGIWATLPGCIGQNCSFPATTVWSYGPDADPMPDSTDLGGGPGIAPAANSQFNYPAYTVEATSNLANLPANYVTVDWINGLVKDHVACKNSATPATDPACNFIPHLLPVDRSLHWANPEQLPCIEIGKTKDCAPDPKNGPILQQPYDGPVPMVVHVHGAHAGPESDGYAEAWWLPNANNIPATYAKTGTLVNQFATLTNTVPGVGSYSYPNSQPSSTIWYHDHALGMTRSNVYAGPAGFWLLRDANAPGGETGLAADDFNGRPQALPGPAPVAGEGLAETNLPPGRNKYREIPIVIQDRSFNADGSLFYPDNRAFFEGVTPELLQIPFIGDPIPSDIAAIWNPEAFFNTMVVNGVTWPTLQVEPDLYRFRLLNGCNSRFLNLALVVVNADGTLGAELPFYQIGAEQSLLPKVVKIVRGDRAVLPGDGSNPDLTPAPLPDYAVAPPAVPEEAVPGLLMGNAERADVIVDFRGLEPGTRVRMINTGPDEPFGGFPGPAADPGTTGQVMEFSVGVDDENVGEGFTAPASLVLSPVENVDTYPAGLPNIVAQARDQALAEEESILICVTVNGGTGEIIYDPNAVPNPADPATCVVTGTTDIAPSVPFGPKAAVLGINGASPAPTITLWSDPIRTNPLYDAAGNPPVETWEFWNHTVDAHPIHVHEVKFKVLNREAFDPATGALVPATLRDPEATEAGWKDTVIALPGEVTRITATFDLPGLYVWHCHIVEHEDNEMMVPYCTGNMDPAKGPIANGCQTLLPAQLYLSLEAGGTLTGLGPNGTNLVFADEDILSWNGANYTMVFDGSAAGLSPTADISAFDIDHANNRILMAFNSTQYLRGIGWITGSDIVAYDLVKKTFSLVFDGSDVGLVTATELLDAIEFLPNGKLIVSTNGSTSVPSGGPVPLAAVDQDLLVFTPATLGSATTGTWAVYFDGSDVGLATVGEGVNGASIAKNGDIYLSTVGSFAVTGLSGQNEDVFVCKNPTTGPTTACNGGFSLFFDGTTKGLGTNIVDAIDLP